MRQKAQCAYYRRAATSLSEGNKNKNKNKKIIQFGNEHFHAIGGIWPLTGETLHTLKEPYKNL